MSVKLRLSRVGAKKNPFYRVVVTDSRNPRDGKFIEHIGIYDPNRDPVEIRFDMERVKHWLSVGAQPSEKVAAILKRHGIQKPKPGEPWELPPVKQVPTGQEGQEKQEAAPPA